MLNVWCVFKEPGLKTYGIRVFWDLREKVKRGGIHFASLLISPRSLTTL
jgi:hypothetical protein